MWLTEAEEQWLRDSLMDEPDWLREMVLENFGLGRVSFVGGFSMREVATAFAALGGYQPTGPTLDPLRIFAPGQRASAVQPPPQIPANDPFGNPRLDTTWE